MTDRKTSSSGVELSVASLKKIKEALVRLDKDEREALQSLKKSKKSTEANLLKLNNMFLTARVELYNRKSQIESKLANSSSEPPAKGSAPQVAALIKELNIAEVLHPSRAKGVTVKSCWTNCVECITSCTECVTSCTQCVTSAGAGGGCGLTTLVASPCVPKPDIGDQI